MFCLRIEAFYIGIFSDAIRVGSVMWSDVNVLAWEEIVFRVFSMAETFISEKCVHTDH